MYKILTNYLYLYCVSHDLEKLTTVYTLAAVGMNRRVNRSSFLILDNVSDFRGQASFFNSCRLQFKLKPEMLHLETETSRKINNKSHK